MLEKRRYGQRRHLTPTESFGVARYERIGTLVLRARRYERIFEIGFPGIERFAAIGG